MPGLDLLEFLKLKILFGFKYGDIAGLKITNNQNWSNQNGGSKKHHANIKSLKQVRELATKNIVLIFENVHQALDNHSEDCRQSINVILKTWLSLVKH